MEVDRSGLEVLDRNECLRLLGTATLGRIGITSGALPAVLPVNFRFDGSRILIATGMGTKLDAATRNAVVAFEVDEMDPLAHTGWSVIVRGVAREVDPGELAEAPPLVRWVPGPERQGHRSVDRARVRPAHRARRGGTEHGRRGMMVLAARPQRNEAAT